MGKSNTNNRKKLILLYGCRDMLTLIETEKLEFHHLLKKALGGKSNIENGALLDEYIHDWLHSLEISDPDLYDLINECLYLFKVCLDYGLEDLIYHYEKEVASRARVLIRHKKNEENTKRKTG